MKKMFTTVLALFIVFSLNGCSLSSGHDVDLTIVIPAGSTEEFVYSDIEISPQKNKLSLYAGDDSFPDTEVFLLGTEVEEENAYEPTYITHGTPIKIDVEKGAWFKVGVNVQNPSEEDIVLHLTVKNVKLRGE